MKRLVLAILLALSVWSSPVAAHDVPDVVRVTIFMKPEPGRILMLVRVPTNAFIDFMFPMFENGGLDLTQAGAAGAEGAKVWIADILSLSENGAEIAKAEVLKTRISRLNDPFFNTFQDALGHMDAPPLPVDTYLTQDQAAVDALVSAPIASPDASFTFEPRFGRLGVLVYTTLTFMPPRGELRQFYYEGDPEAFALNPARKTVFMTFARTGIAHYFGETEYLLFVLCIALILQSVAGLALFAIVLAAGEVTAVVAALAFMPATPWVPVLCGVLVAAATTYMGIEAIVGGPGRRLGLAITAGAIVGCGFWRGLQQIVQFGGAHPFAAGVGFSAGAIVSELAALTTIAVAGGLLLKLSRAPRAIVVIAAALAIHVSWRQMIDRAGGFALAPGRIPPAELAALVAIVGGAIALRAAAANLRRKRAVGATGLAS